jgi:hypothetical protein
MSDGEQSHETYGIGGSQAGEGCRGRADSGRGDHPSGCWMFQQFEQFEQQQADGISE